MNKLFLLLLAFPLQLFSQIIDTGSILTDLHHKLRSVQHIQADMAIKKRYIYERDTTVRLGAFRIDYEGKGTNSSLLLSIYEDEYKRYLIYDTSGGEYVYNVKNDKISTVRMKGDSSPINETFFPRCYNRFDDFADWLLKPHSKTRITYADDSIVMISFVGEKSADLKLPPIVNACINRGNGLFYSMETILVLPDDEIQYEYITMDYTGSQGADVLYSFEAAHHKLKMCEADNTISTISENKPLGFKKGKHCENFIVTNTDGKEMTIPQSNGKYLLIDFWYISCKPCAEAIPEVSRLYEQFNKSMDIVSVNPFDAKKEILAFKERKNIAYPAYTANVQVLNHFNIKGFPLFILVAPNGKILYIQEGFSSDMYNIITKKLKE